jgi:hypothetical protein
MPLRDHFRSPVTDRHTWDELHGSWPTFIAMALKPKLPPGYVAVPRIHLAAPEVDVASFEVDTFSESSLRSGRSGGVATRNWIAPKPTIDVAADPPDQDEYEVRVYDTELDRRLVAAVEIISPSNKDRPAKRRAFIRKCAALLQERVSIALVDLVTIRRANLYKELLAAVGQDDPSFRARNSSIYAAVSRWTQKGSETRFQSWSNVLTIGRPLPTLPLWLTDDLAVPMDLETSYEQACDLVDIK